MKVFFTHNGIHTSTHIHAHSENAHYIRRKINISHTQRNS